jgi:phosphoenolpyruvate carboxykinase (GTP)
MIQTNPQAEELNKTILNNSPTIFSLLSKNGKAIYFPKKGILGQSAEAKGKKINATIGIAVEDSGEPMRLKSIEDNIKIPAEMAFSYAPSFGRLDLREKWKSLITEKNPSLKNKQISLPVVTNALTHGLSIAGYLFLDEEDKIIIPEPFWGNYNLTFSNAYHAEIDTFEMFKNGEFNLEALRQKLSGNNEKKILLLNFPNNPSGYTPRKEEMKEIAKTIKESAEAGNKILVIIDDAYFGLVYQDGIEKESIFSLLCDLHENILAVKLDGATKEDYVWGFRVGFITFGIKNGNKETYEALEAKTAGAIRGNISNASNLSQSLILKAFESPSYKEEKQEKYNLLKERYDEVHRVLKNPKYKSYFDPLPYNSGYFMCIKLNGLDAEEIRKLLLVKYDTGVIALQDKLRIAFSAVKKQDIEQLFENIYLACKESKADIKAMMDKKSYDILKSVDNKYVERIIERYASLCKPNKIVILDDSPSSLQFARENSIEHGEEKPLAMKGHTIHFDSQLDQGRDLQNTRVLLPKNKKMSKVIETIDKDSGLKEVFTLMDGIMQGKTMYVKFYCLGPENSKFSIPALQLTDSLYVIHSEDILYRQGYNEFKKLSGKNKFFHFVHSAGRTINGISQDIDKRRVFMDLEDERVFTINNQYAGNSVGLKKLALRLAISKANREDWLCEHMFIMGARPLNKDRITYFTGAFPSACGKTSTAMIPGQTIVGDDIAYLRIDNEGKVKAANVEQGIFGIIEDINPKDDALINKALTTERELIFSNVLVNSGVPYWLGMGKEAPEEGINYQGAWKKGMKNAEGKDILLAHKNARYTIKINDLDNRDSQSDNPEGVPISGFIYGGRDSDTSVPVSEALSWQHGVFLGTTIESETTATTTGKVGVRKHNPMSNIEFLVVPLSTYIKNHLKFGERLDKTPLIFATNYFLKENDKYLNDKTDKKVWLLWMEGRVHGEYKAIETPVGFIPLYEDIKHLFKQIFNKDYTKEMYEKQFSIRAKNYLDKLNRMEQIFKEEEDIPEEFHIHLNQQKQRLNDAIARYKKDTINPFEFLG